MQKFDPLKTEKGTFHVTKEKSVKVDFMHMVGWYIRKKGIDLNHDFYVKLTNVFLLSICFKLV